MYLSSTIKILARDIFEKLELIYELTYKYQQLRQEEKFGDYGLPKILEDRAYNELSKIKGTLSEVLNDVHDDLDSTFDNWIAEHDPENNGEYFYDTAADYVRELYSTYDYEDIVERDSSFPEIVLDWAITYIDEDKTKYIDAELEAIYKDNQKDILDDYFNSGNTVIDDKIDSTIQEFMEAAYWEPPFSTVREFKKEKLDDYLQQTLDDRILIFQEALTIAHNNGEMSEHLLSNVGYPYYDETTGTRLADYEFLDMLSAGPKVDQWNKEIQKVLGYEPGSRLLQEEKFDTRLQPKRDSRITRIVSYLVAFEI